MGICAEYFAKVVRKSAYVRTWWTVYVKYQPLVLLVKRKQIYAVNPYFTLFSVQDVYKRQYQYRIPSFFILLLSLFYNLF